MTTLVFGAGGAALGTAIFPPGAILFGLSGASLGWIAGSMLGSAIGAKDVSIQQQGPRLTDLKVQVSTYGQPIPRVFGRVPISGNVIWSSDIIEEAHTSSQSQGGKGGGDTTVTQTTYSYKVNLAVGICEGSIQGVRKIWANGKLIYNVDSAASASTVVASQAVGGVIARIVDPSLSGADAIAAGNIRIYLGSETQVPDSLMEAYEGANNVPAYRGLAYAVFEAFELAEFGNRIPSFEFEVMRSGTPTAPVAVSTIPTTAGARTSSWDDGVYAVCTLSTTGSGATFRKRIYDTAGTLLSDQTTTRTRVTGSNLIPQGNWHGIVYDEYSTTSGKWWNVETNEENDAAWLANHAAMVPQLWKGSQYGYYLWRDESNVWKAAKLAIQGGVPSPMPEKILELITSAQTHHSFFDGTFWFADSANGVLYRYDADLTLLEQWTYVTPGAGHGQIYVFGDRFFIAQSAVGARLFQLNADGTTTQLSSSSPDSGAPEMPFPATPGIVIGLTKLVSVTPTIAADDTTTLSSIVTELCELAGLTASDINVTALTDSVKGYVVPRRAPLRAALEPLMAAYFFDAVESDGKIKFVVRGGASAVTLSADDMDARPEGSEPGDVVSHTRRLDLELPREVAVLFMNDGAGYEQGAQYARRLATDADNESTLELPVVLTDTEAKAVADAILFDAWAARDVFSFRTGREYAKYEPGDVVSIPYASDTLTVRITKRDDGADGVISWESVLAESTVYTQSASTQSAEAPDETLGLAGPTNLELLDIPLLRDYDDQYGFYGAAAGYLDDWLGATLFMSRDGGASYDDIEDGVFANGATMGYAEGALGSTLPFGLEQFDETNTVTVRITSGDTLASVTMAQVLDGSNVALLGNEIIQFRDATLVATGRYTLSGLLRGRLGTDWAVDEHAANERFVLLDRSGGVRFIRASSAEVNAARTFKAPALGTSLAGAVAESFTYTGVNLKPLAPVHITGGRDASGNLTMSCTRRTRLNAVWRDYVDAPLGEDSESYSIDILSVTSPSEVVRTLTSTTNSVTYTEAQQVADFGSPLPAQVQVDWYQVSAQVGRGYVASATI